MAVIPIQVMGRSTPAVSGQPQSGAPVPKHPPAETLGPNPLAEASQWVPEDDKDRGQPEEAFRQARESVEKEPPESGRKPETEATVELARAYERLAADFRNYKRHAEKDMANAAAKGRDELLRALIPVLSDLTSAARANGDDAESVRRGVALIRAKLDDILARTGYTRIEAVDRKMDPRVHEAVATTQAHGVPDGQILEEMTPGYTRDGHLVQPARVVVAKGHLAADAGGPAGPWPTRRKKW